uniref:SH3 domain-containing protein n=1 Tax=Biomphalaria glabrata TaxID=6526 RepID=A0A2C9LDR5_BIOGL
MIENILIHFQLKVRCLFSFDPETDEHIPCREAGLKFKIGDILEIVNDEDSTWWQAKFVADSMGINAAGTISSARLIPSKHYQESVEIMRRVLLREAKNPPRSISPCRYSPKIPKQKRLRKTMYHIVQSGGK